MLAKIVLILSIISVTSAMPRLVRMRRSPEQDPSSADGAPAAGATPSRTAKALGFFADQSRQQKQEIPDDSSLSLRQRQNKALAYLDFLPQFFSTDDDYGDEDQLIIAPSDARVDEDLEDEDDISRTIPSRRKPANPYKDFTNTNSLGYDNSPIYYIRLPPTPYMFVPGLGYVSQPPQIAPPVPQVNPFINLPIDFVSNGKPTNIYQWSGAPAFPQAAPVNPFAPQAPFRPSRPQSTRPSYSSYQRPVKKPIVQDTKITNLNKGPYTFNGKPTDIFVLRDSYNSLYSDALQNFYP